MNKFSWKWAVVAAVLTIGGCGDGGPPLYKAGGKVTYKDQAVEGAAVTFAYDDGNFANAVTAADGTFQLAYKGNPKGAALGKCKVGITKVKAISTASTGPAISPKDAKKNPEEYKKQMQAMQDAQKKYMEDKAAEDAKGGPTYLIPKKYSDANNSGLNYEITTDAAKNNFDIKLVD